MEEFGLRNWFERVSGISVHKSPNASKIIDFCYKFGPRVLNCDL